MRPAIALAAAMAGLMRWLRVCGPCLPSKFRFVVVATRWPAKRLLPMSAHKLQPLSCHSKPAALNTRSSPSASAACFTDWDPGTQTACTPGATRWAGPALGADTVAVLKGVLGLGDAEIGELRKQGAI